MRAMKIPYLTASRDRFDRLARIAAVLRVDLQHVESLADLPALLKHDPPAALITDCDLADGNWRDVVEFCRFEAPGVRILVTGRTNSSSIWTEVSEAGAEDFLAQPFYAPEVRRCLLSLAERLEHEHLLEAAI